MTTVQNIRKLAKDCFDAKTGRPSRDAVEIWRRISLINFRELGDREIANLMCNTGYCLPVKAAAVVRRCDELMNG